MKEAAATLSTWINARMKICNIWKTSVFKDMNIANADSVFAAYCGTPQHDAALSCDQLGYVSHEVQYKADRTVVVK